jgi:hypothetical protein
VQQPSLDLQGGAGTNLGNKNPNVQNPMENQDRKEEADVNNTEGQMRSKRQIKKKATGPTAKDRDYPYGAVQPEFSTDDPQAFIDRALEVLAIVRNPIENSENINHVRDFSKPKEKKPAKSLNSKSALKETIDDTAVFYKGTDQLSESGENAKT